MASVNAAVLRKPAERVAGGLGSVAERISNFESLRRCVMACLLWENNAYDDGQSVADRIVELVPKCNPLMVENLAIIARHEMKLRHVPLLLCRELARTNNLSATTLANVIQRPDEMCEFLALLWKDGKCAVPNQVKKGLALAFGKFDKYQLGKWKEGSKSIKLRDVMMMVHPKPSSIVQSNLYKSVLDNSIEAPDTWEVGLSTGGNKKDVFTDLISRGKLPAVALLKNLRGMQEAGVDKDVIKQALLSMNTERILPFEFLRASEYAKEFLPQLEEAMFKCLSTFDKLNGKTVLVIDVSGSMTASMSAKGLNRRIDAATALAILLREICSDITVYITAGNDGTRIHRTASIPAYRGFAIRDQLDINRTAREVGAGGIFLVQCMDYVYSKEKNAERVIVITDEQDTSGTKLNMKDAKLFGKYNYVINIASERNGVGYRPWIHIDGFSEHVIRYIGELENFLSNSKDNHVQVS